MYKTILLIALTSILSTSCADMAMLDKISSGSLSSGENTLSNKFKYSDYAGRGDDWLYC